jgi:hypothetical protein
LSGDLLQKALDAGSQRVEEMARCAAVFQNRVERKAQP